MNAPSSLFSTFSRETHVIPIADIKVPEGRQRKEFVLDDLKASIARKGLQSPLLVTRDLFLVTGERRLRACKELGHHEVIIRFVDELDPIELQIIEWEENFARKDLSWQEQCEAIATIHRLYCEINPEQTQQDTAQRINLTPGHVSKCVTLWEELQKDNKKLEGATGIMQAHNLISRKDQRASARALEELIGASPVPASTNRLEIPPPGPLKVPAGEANAPVNLLDQGIPSKPIVAPAPVPQVDPVDPKRTLVDVWHGSFLEWAPSYRGPKFNLIHCDFPYGVNLFSGPMGAQGADIEYEDGRDIFFTMLECFCDNLENFASLSCHFIFWFSFEHYAPMMAMLRNKAPSIEWIRDPLIWGKSDNAGIVRDSRKHPRHAYESALMGFRGNRNVVENVADFYSAPTDRKLHPSAKPEPMLRHFFRMLVDEHTELLDPTCGAGSSLRAADSLGAQRVFGIELNPEHASITQTTLNISRRLRTASKTIETK